MKKSIAELCNAFTMAPVLALFHPAKPFCLETEASRFAIAGIILQWQQEVRCSTAGVMHSAKGHKPVGRSYWHLAVFWPWSMSPVKQNYAVGNLEMLAIIMTCCHWLHYLESAGHPVRVLMDHNNLQRFMTTTLLMDWQAHWLETLSGYNVNIVNKAGLKNPADTHSYQ
jgi:hypothetical protein